jgi:two-component system, cell cycle sensor histidine kinase and response regulator CckA
MRSEKERLKLFRESFSGLWGKFFSISGIWTTLVLCLWVWFHYHELHDLVIDKNTNYSMYFFLMIWALGLTGHIFNFLSLHKSDLERHRVGRALEKSHRLHQDEQNMFTSGPIVTFRWKNEKNWPVEYVSPNVQTIFGYSPEDFKSGKILYGSLIVKADQERVYEEVLAAEENGTKSFTHAPYRIRCKNGRVLWVDDHSIVIRNKESRLTHFQGYIVDISARIEAEDEREQAQEFTQTVMDSLPEGMLVINLDYSIALANRAALKSAGDPSLALSEQSCYAFSHGSKMPCDGDKHRCPLKEVYTTKSAVRVEHHHKSASGADLVIEIIAAPIFDKQGEVVQVIETFRDVTERKEIEEAKFDLERRLLHSQKLESLGVLAGGIAHDFNNLLMAILGNADLALLEMSPVSPARRSIMEITTASRHAADLAKQMLAYSGKGRFVLEPIHAGELLSEMSHLLEVSISKHVILKYKNADNLPRFMGDASQVRQVVMNLITNASEAIGEKSGVVALSTGAMDCDRFYLDTDSDFQFTAPDEPLPEGMYVYFEVSDTGCGMDAKTNAKIFDPFFTTKFTGRGLGMSALQGIVRGHRGTIKIYSEQGVGTTFKVLFPVGEPEQEIDDSEAQPVEAISKWKSSGVILIVDDEPTVLAVGGRMLEHAGFDVLKAGDGREAMEVFREHHESIVCVLLDLTMPHMDGTEVFRQMRLINPTISVVLCSGYNEHDALQNFTVKGLAGFIQKPYTLAVLREKLVKVLD